MPTPIYNDVEFKAEDAFALLLAPVATALTLQIRKSLVVETLEDEHIAIIAEEADPSEGRPNTGNWRIPIRFKVVTAIDQPASAGDVRELHRARCGQVRDAIMRDDLPDVLSASLADFTVQQFFIGRIQQRIAGRHWVGEFTITLDPVCGTDE